MVGMQDVKLIPNYISFKISLKAFFEFYKPASAGIFLNKKKEYK